MNGGLGGTRNNGFTGGGVNTGTGGLGGFGYGGHRGRRLYPGRRGYGGYGYRYPGGGGLNGGYGFGQNGDGLSDYAPYGRPVLGCDPTTPSRAHPGCY